MVDELQVHGCQPSENELRRATFRRRVAGGGIVLVAAGVLWLIERVAELDVERLWPIGILALGFVVMSFSLLVREPGREWTLIVGAALAVVGAVLQYQLAFDRWESWTYMWLLVEPTSLGAAVLLAVHWKWVDEGAESVGARLLFGGLVLWWLGFLVFEGVLRIGNLALQRETTYLLPTTILILGAFLTVRHSPGRESDGEAEN